MQEADYKKRNPTKFYEDTPNSRAGRPRSSRLRQVFVLRRSDPPCLPLWLIGLFTDSGATPTTLSTMESAAASRARVSCSRVSTPAPGENTPSDIVYVSWGSVSRCIEAKDVLSSMG